jgi:hypothetical protein
VAPGGGVVTAPVDTRPRVDYVLPDGAVVQVIHDHGEYHRPVIRFTLADGRIVLARRAS